MTEPSTNHIDLHTGLEQMDGSGVSKEVRSDSAWFSACRIPTSGMPPDNLIDAKTCECSGVP